jgi:hypothetical protein
VSKSSHPKLAYVPFGPRLGCTPSISESCGAPGGYASLRELGNSCATILAVSWLVGGLHHGPDPA